MLPTVTLVTFPFRRGEASARDTIQGVSRVVGWLEQLRGQTAGTEAPFVLRAREILICDAGAVERGEYPLGGVAASRSGTNRQRYMALWEPEGDRWKLAGLWLSPPASVRPATLGTNCRRDAVAARLLRFGAGFAAGEAVGLGSMADALAADGYTDQSPAKGTVMGIHLWARVRISPRFAGKLSYGYVAETRLETRDTATAYVSRVANLDAVHHVIGLLGEVNFGAVTIGVGPGVSLTRVHYYQKTVSTTRTWGTLNTDDIVGIGFVSEISGRYPITPSLNAVGVAQYSRFPDAETSLQLAGAAAVPGAQVAIGLEWIP
jgi:hypothetical protein